MESSERTILISLFGVLFLLVVGGIYIAYADSKKKYPFNPYVRKAGPSGAGPITGETPQPITPAEKAKREKILNPQK